MNSYYGTDVKLILYKILTNLFHFILCILPLLSGLLLSILFITVHTFFLQKNIKSYNSLN